MVDFFPPDGKDIEISGLYLTKIGLWCIRNCSCFHKTFVCVCVCLFLWGERGKQVMKMVNVCLQFNFLAFYCLGNVWICFSILYENVGFIDSVTTLASFFSLFLCVCVCVKMLSCTTVAWN